MELGERVAIGPNCTVLGPCRIGDDTILGAGLAVGGPPEISSLRQNLAWAGDLDHAGVVIGEGAVLGDLVVIHQGSIRPTTVGTGAWVLNSSYLAHDVEVGRGAVVSAGTRMGGHSFVGAFANLGMGTIVHQRRSIGHGAMVGMGTPVTRDVPPFGKVYGSPPRLQGVNAVGLRRLGIEAAIAEQLAAEFERGDVGLDILQGLDEELVREAVAWWCALPDRRAVQPEGRGPEL